MKLSLNWIQDYIDLSGIDHKELINRLTLSTCEVEEFAPAFATLKGVKVATIIGTEKHPGADRLQICDIECGTFRGKIVCGAPNARPGISVPFAPVDSEIPGKDGTGLKIQKANIRGVESLGMLCSAAELGLEKIFPGDGILELNYQHGKAMSEILGSDMVLTIDNKSITNRPDLWGHFGFARELAAIFGKKIKFDPLTAARKFKPSKSNRSIKIETGSALAYFGAVCENVKVTDTPLWMKLRLAAVGQKSINSIVDVSNYAMLELAQPNHTFDLSHLKTPSILVGLSNKHGVSKFKTLDGQERPVPSDTVMIFDGPTNPVALGGIMGGEGSAIMPNTTSIFIESATFPRELIRRTLKKMDLRTDSAMRFEKGQDPAKAKPSIGRIAQLLQETCPDLTLGPITGSSVPIKKSKIKVTLEFLQARLGFAISKKEVESILRGLGYEVKGDKSGKSFSLTAPSYRSQYDITIPEDIVEELGRMHGYDNIKASPALSPVSGKSLDLVRILDRRMRELLRSVGFSETMNYSFCTLADNKLFGAPGIEIQNPVGGLTHLRTSLLPGLLKQVVSNQDRYATIRMFEFSRTYPGKDASSFLHSQGPANERKTIALAYVLPDKTADETVFENSFVEFRETILNMIRLSGKTPDVTPTQIQTLHPRGSLSLNLDNKPIGILGLLHPVTAVQFDLKRPTLVCEFSFDAIASEIIDSSYKPPSIYPDSLFEITVILDDKISAREPVDKILSLGHSEIADLELLNVYRGAPIDEGKKAVSYRIRCRKTDGTFSHEQWKAILDNIIVQLEKAGMPLRR